MKREFTAEDIGPAHRDATWHDHFPNIPAPVAPSVIEENFPNMTQTQAHAALDHWCKTMIQAIEEIAAMYRAKIEANPRQFRLS